jgi:hypothetical protein
MIATRTVCCSDASLSRVSLQFRQGPSCLGNQLQRLWHVVCLQQSAGGSSLHTACTSYRTLCVLFLCDVDEPCMDSRAFLAVLGSVTRAGPR